MHESDRADEMGYHSAMKFSLVSLDDGYVINSYEPGVIQVNQEKHYSSLLLMPDRLITGWEVDTVGQLTLEQLSAIARYQPDILILGTGERQEFPHPALFTPLMEQGIGYEVMNTAAACRTYNVLLSEGRKVLAALIP